MLINNQRYAQLAGVNYTSEKIGKGSIVYSRTHTVVDQFRKLGQLAASQPITLVTSFSDDCVTQEMADALPDNVHWFSNNVRCDHPRVTAIPIGCTFNTEREKAILSAMEAGRPAQQNLMYVNFTEDIPRAPNPRHGLYSLFDKPWATQVGGSTLTGVSPTQFYHDIASHPYVLSPHGAGPDCHRHWEAMLLGSIPIVLRDKANDILEGLPALRVNDWSHLTLDLLLRLLPEMQERMGNREELFMPYWEKMIRSTSC